MSFEIPPVPAEKEPGFLTLSEITTQIERLAGKEQLETVRTLEDEKGIYLHEMVTVDEKGNAALYIYQRVGDKTANTIINIAYFEGKLEDDVCTGGTSLSNYDETTGAWTDC